MTFWGRTFGRWLGLKGDAFMHRTVLCLVTQSCPALCDPWTIAHQASLSIGSSKQEYWSGLLSPPPGDLSSAGIVPRFDTTWITREAQEYWSISRGNSRLRNGTKVSCIAVYSLPAEMHRISALLKETPGSSLACSVRRRHREKTIVFKPGSGSSLNLLVPWS